MPQASKALQDTMFGYFGSRVDEGPPCEFLKNAGYELTKDWQWLPKPGVKTCADMTKKECDCIVFLIEEWDFGGLIEVE